ncbi:MAG: FAD-dependent oxidoreductase [Dehalococcoidia bacterium]|nr:FAD-dependent oxidoreductase [Dehalococcoidia bacterium]
MIDAASFPEGHSFEADVCVIGSGPAGMTLALELQKTGSRVLLVEASGEEPEIRAADARGITEGWPYPSLEDTRTRGFGGTSAQWTPETRWSPHYGMGSRPLDGIDLEARPWVRHSGWPFDKEHLRPYYERAHEIAGLGPVEYEVTPEHAAAFGEPLAVKSERMKTVLVRFAKPADVRAHRPTLAEASNVTVLLNARAVEIETAEDPQHVSRIRLQARGRGLWASANLFVLATGGIENARLLLLSDRTYPKGIGNGEDLVGRYFMEHVVLNPRSADAEDAGFLPSLPALWPPSAGRDRLAGDDAADGRSAAARGAADGAALAVCGQEVFRGRGSEVAGNAGLLLEDAAEAEAAGEDSARHRGQPDRCGAGDSAGCEECGSAPA